MLEQIPMHKININPYSTITRATTMPYTHISSSIPNITDFVVVDTETTGLNGEYDRIVELSAVKFKNNQPIAIFETLINPKCNIPYNTIRVHGITNEMVKDAPTIAQVIEDFDQFLEDLPIVGHNLLFDLKFIHYSGSTILQNHTFYCTYRIASKRIPKPYPIQNHKLGTLCNYYNIQNNNQHRAYADAYATGILFKKLQKDCF